MLLDALDEASGALDVVLDRIADHSEGSARLQRRARTAMTYPAIMTVVGGGIVLFLLAYGCTAAGYHMFFSNRLLLPFLPAMLILIGDLLESSRPRERRRCGRFFVAAVCDG